jgi:hypothetical protein
MIINKENFNLRIHQSDDIIKHYFAETKVKPLQ